MNTATDDDFTADLNDAEWKTILAFTQIVQKRGKVLETHAKTHLLDRLEPGQPEQAMLGDKVAAEISVTKGGATAKPKVKDIDAYVAWLIEHGHESDLETVTTPKKHALEQSYIDDATKENGGELPDGIEPGTPSRPTVRVSLTKGIVDDPLDTSALSMILPLLGIEAAPQSTSPQESEEEDDPWAAN